MKRVLIANRGEIACRVIRACRALSLETVAVHSDADAGALHVQMADVAVAIGPPPARASYLDIDRIVAAALDTASDAIHPGYGFLSESSRFARAAVDRGITWIGPSPESIDDMGDKDRARSIAQAAGVPILPGSGRYAADALDGIADVARTVGYPLLIKATGGGGGIGMRRVDSPGALDAMVVATQQQATKSFGDGTIYLERYVPRARHVEIQVFGYGDGRAVHLFERECSIQRRFQKVIEESPAPGLPAAMTARMAEVAAALAAHQRYRGPGTVEFIVDADTLEFYFLEMNTRIQVEHPVTEMVTGWDLVQEQIRLAAGEAEAAAQSDIRRTGAAIECRLYAENPAKGFLPSPGRLDTFSLPAQMPDVRIETGVREGDTITPYYDPMIAKVIARGADRPAAIDRMLAALDESRIGGVRNNLEFVKAILRHPQFRAGSIDTGLIDREKTALLAAMPAA